MGWIIFLGVIAVIAAMPWILEAMRKPMAHKARNYAPGEFVALSGGVTHYQWFGPIRGPVAVLVHGLTTPSVVWTEIADGLADIGYRVLVYDLYGRGYSDKVAGPQNEQFFLTQLDELLADQGLEDDLTLVGYSMGASIAAAFAAVEPHRMKRLIALAPSGVMLNESAFSRFCRQTPILGDWLHGALGALRMRRTIANDPAQVTAAPVIAAQLAELKRKGFVKSVLASRRGLLNETQERQYRAIAHDGIPTIVIWGEDDEVVPVAAVGRMAQWNRIAHHEVVPGAGHSLPYSHAAEVVGFLRQMLRDN